MKPMTQIAIRAACAAFLFTAPAAAQQLSTDAAGRLTLQLQELEQQVRESTGQFEEVLFRLRRLEERLEAVESGLGQRLDRLESGAAQSGGRSDAAPAPTASAESLASALPDGDAETRYAYIFQLLQRQNYGEAERALTAFLSAHPSDERAPSAKFWLGETYRARGDYESAALQFAEGFQQFPQDRKAPDMLLKLGDSLAALGERDKACGTYDLLRQQFPEAPSNIRTMTERGLKRAQCS